MVVKTQIVLYIYDKLIKKEEVTTEFITNKFDISIPTFRRYISEINSYLFNFQTNQEVVYSRQKRSYILPSTLART